MNIAIAQSGGPTCTINASLAGVYRFAAACGKFDTIYGAHGGIEGIINEHLIDLSGCLKTEDEIDMLIHTPGAALGSCRYKLPADGYVYYKIIDCFKKNEIGMFFYIGGNDSMDTVAKLSEYFLRNNINIKIIGIPKTIDNDLCYTDHTPGFGSAAKFVNAAMQEIIRDSCVYGAPSVTVVEIMGRHAGWLSASACCLRSCGETAPHLIYLPEAPFSTKKFIKDVEIVQKEHKAVIVAVSECVKIPDADFYQSQKLDVFGHHYLSGIGKCLENLITNELGCKVRSIELNVLQRCSSHIASATDLSESEMIGAAAVEAALCGKTGCMMTYVRESNSPYKIGIGDIPASKVANFEKHFPSDWINEDGNNITNEALDYFLPLIQGEVDLKMKNGIPVHFVIPLT